MTDKELKKLSKLELLELLLNQTHENERLRSENEQLKREIANNKSTAQLNEKLEQLELLLTQANENNKTENELEWSKHEELIKNSTQQLTETTESLSNALAQVSNIVEDLNKIKKVSEIMIRTQKNAKPKLCLFGRN